MQSSCRKRAAVHAAPFHLSESEAIARMNDDNSNETSMDAEDITLVFEGAEVFVRRCLGRTCVPLGHPAELVEYDAWLRKAIEDIRRLPQAIGMMLTAVRR